MDPCHVFSVNVAFLVIRTHLRFYFLTRKTARKSKILTQTSGLPGAVYDVRLNLHVLLVK